LRVKFWPLNKYRKEKERVISPAQAAELQKYGNHDVEVAIAQLEGNIENLMLTETVGPEHIAEAVSRWTGIPVTRLSQNESEVTWTS